METQRQTLALLPAVPERGRAAAPAMLGVDAWPLPELQAQHHPGTNEVHCDSSLL